MLASSPLYYQKERKKNCQFCFPAKYGFFNDETGGLEEVEVEAPTYQETGFTPKLSNF